MYPEILREALNPPLDEVKELNITCLLEPELSSTMVELVDSLLWLAPRLRILSIIDDMYRTIFRIKVCLWILFYVHQQYNTLCWSMVD